MSDQNRTEEKTPSPQPSKRWIAAGLILAGVLCLAYYFGTARQPVPQEPSSSQEESSQEAEASSSDPTADYPEGKLFITRERSQYESGAMTLTVPRLALEELPVLGDVDYETLKGGVGLYEYAQMPGTGNRNVSIAGHRDVYGKEFYTIDTLTEGDEMTLDYQGKKYIYRYKDTRVVEEDDWSPIYIQGFSCLTLTSCTPIGVASHRIIVRGELVRVEEAGESSTVGTP